MSLSAWFVLRRKTATCLFETSHDAEAAVLSTRLSLKGRNADLSFNNIIMPLSFFEINVLLFDLHLLKQYVGEPKSFHSFLEILADKDFGWEVTDAEYIQMGRNA